MCSVLMADVRVITSDFVDVTITTSRNRCFCSLKRFAKCITISEFKGKLEMITGGSAATMKLQLFSNDDQLICDLCNEDAILGSFPIDDGMRIHVTDQFTFEDDSVAKYMLTVEEYDKRPGTVRNFLRTNKMGPYDEERAKKRKEEKEAERIKNLELALNIKVGDRCKVNIFRETSCKGVVMYNGEIEGHPDVYIGVKYDEPFGKNDGTASNGKKYFDCPSNYGVYVRPYCVEVGDFPEDEILFNEDDEEI